MRNLYLPLIWATACTVGGKDATSFGVQAFSSLSASPVRNHVASSSPRLWMASTVVDTTEEEDTATTRTGKGLLKRDRYIVTNRFSVRRDQQAKFEKRWATRKSRLAELEGFQYFHLMRRVTLQETTEGGTTTTTTTYKGGETNEEAFENYVSLTIWNKKSHFSAWRSGEAFKEAHGGTSIGAFMSAMVSSARVLRGAPRPAFYDGLLLQKTKPSSLFDTLDGWRNVPADGVNTLNPECFVSMQKFYIPPDDSAVEFEEFWKKQQPDMTQTPGFVARSVMRRDGQAKGHGVVQMQASEPSYVIVTIFQDLPSYQAWAAASPSLELPASFSAVRAPGDRKSVV